MAIGGGSGPAGLGVVYSGQTIDLGGDMGTLKITHNKEGTEASIRPPVG